MSTSSAIPVRKQSLRTRVTAETAFLLTAGAILGLTGLAKISTAFGSAKLLATVDPIFGIRFRDLMQAVGLAELAVAGVCVFTKARRLATILVASLATGFLIYRLGLSWLQWTKPCGCLGNLTDALHISPHVANIILMSVLTYLLFASYLLLAISALKQRSRTA